VANVKKFTSACSVKKYFHAGATVRRNIGDSTMAIAEQARLETIQRTTQSHDTAILLGYSIFAIVLLIAIYLASMSSGTAPGDFASMTVFP
jgi:hypothetical protein